MKQSRWLISAAPSLGWWHLCCAFWLFCVVPPNNGRAFEASQLDASKGALRIYGDADLIAAVTSNPPVISIEDIWISEPATNAGSRVAQFTVLLSSPSTNTISVDVRALGGIATYGTDYYFTRATLTFDPGVVCQAAYFAVYEDSLPEPDEAFAVILSNPVGASLGKSNATCTISDYDRMPRLAISSVEVPEGLNDHLVQVPVTLSSASTSTVSVVFHVISGTATAGEDFMATNGVLVFPPGTTNQNIQVSVLGDEREEDDESFQVVLSTSIGAILDNQVATVTLRNDDLAMLSVSDVQVSEFTTFDSYVYFTVSLSCPSTREILVSYYTHDGTAHADADYISVEGTLVFPPGSTDGQVPVPIVNDIFFEATETFSLCLFNANTPISSNSCATASILDDDFPVEIDNVSIVEGDTGTTNAIFQVHLLQSFDVPVVIYYSTVEGTALEGLDYEVNFGTIEFSPGITTQTVTVPVLGDFVAEENEDFYLVLYLQDPNASFFLPYGTCTILDDEPRITISGAAIGEPFQGTNNASFSVRLSKPSEVPVSVEYSTTSGTALAGEDFLPTSGTLVFSPGETNKVIKVSVLADDLWEPTESFVMTLTNAVHASLLVSDAIGNILDTRRPVQSSFKRLIEPIGPSSRMTDLVISEIMYDPPDRFRGASGKDLDFIELYNSGPLPQDIGGYRMTGDISLVFPAGTIIQSHAYLVIPDKPSVFSSVYGITSPFNYTGELPDSKGTVRLQNRAGAVLLEVNYNSEPPWPFLANGKGYSLVLARPSFGEGDPRAWDVSEQVGGSPGAPEQVVYNPLRNVVINELLANSVLPDLDFIELYNRGTQDVNISACSLSDSPDTNKFVFFGAVIPAGGYFALDEISLGFKLKAEGDTVYFRGPDNQVIDSVRFAGQPPGVSVGRFPEGGTEFFPLFPPTPFDRNDTLFSGDIVINEMMYAPITGDSREAYIELFNRTTNAVDVSGWKLTEAVEFTIPAGTSIAPGGYLVIGEDAPYLQGRYPQLNSGNTIGNFSGNLAAEGGQIVLASPAASTQGGTTNIYYVAQDIVSCGLLGSGNQWARSGGSSLELQDAASENRFVANWADSDESGKSTWMTIEVSSTLTNAFDANGVELQVLLLGAGECLVDEVEVLQGGGSNVLVNGSFEAGMAGWLSDGNHSGSCPETIIESPGQHSLHVRAGGNGDTTVNNIRTRIPLLPVLGPVTLRAKARWLHGSPMLVLRLARQNLELSGMLPIPKNLGSPGLPNSHKSSNSGPVITDLQLSPLLPVAGQPVVVTAKLHDPDGISAVTLNYRLDPDSSVTPVPMLDDGSGPDSVAGDGIFTAAIPGQSQGALIAFYVVASDGASVAAISRFPAALAKECLVRFGEEPFSGDISGVRIWMTSSNLALWNSRSLFSDDPLDCTVVYGNSRAIFNAGVHFGTDALERTNILSATNGPCAYSLTFPPGETLLGDGSWNLVAIDPRVDPTLLRRQAVQWMAAQLNLPGSFERFMHVSINGLDESGRGIPIFIDRKVPDPRFSTAWFSDYSPGDLFEIQGCPDLAPDGVSIRSVQDATLSDLLLPGPPRKFSTYQWNWKKFRRQPTDNNFLQLFGLADVLNASEGTYENLVQGTLDVDQWLLAFAFRQGVGDGLSYGFKAGRNAFVYKPKGSKWKLIPGDFTAPLGAVGAVAPTNDVFDCAPAEMRRFVKRPLFARNYLRTLQTVASVTLDSAKLQQEFLAPWSQFLEMNGVKPRSGAQTELLGWVNNRRAYLQGLMPPPSFDLSPPYEVPVTNDVISFGGTASVQFSDIYLGGRLLPVTWTSLTNWSAQFIVPLGEIFSDSPCSVTFEGENVCAPQTITGTNMVFGSPIPPHLVFSELHYSPLQPGAGFIELYNPSDKMINVANVTLPEFDFTFAEPSYIPPHSFVVLAEDRSAFMETYGTAIPLAGELGREFNPLGGIITLFSPGGVLNLVQTNKVKVDVLAPWPRLGGTGFSLQLIDPDQDIARVSNWSPGPPTPGSGSFAVAPAYPLLWLNEVQTMNNGSIRDNAGEGDPWIEIYNSGGTNIVLSSSFYLTDDYSNLTKWPFPSAIVLAPQSFLVVWADAQPEQTVASNLHTNFRLSQTPASLALVQATPDGPRIVDYFNIPALSPGKTYGSLPNGQLFDRDILGLPTPGALNRVPPILINEWMASNLGTIRDPADNDADDWLELYNSGSEPRNLRGYKISDRATSGNPFVIAYDRIIPPHGYFLVWADNETNQNTVTATDIHVPWKLGAKGETILLFAPDGTILDTITFGQQIDNVSQGRFPDGAASIYSMAAPSPASSNRLVNVKPPVVAPIQNRIVTLGQTLVLPIQASDVDTPMAFINYRLGPGAPLGAGVQSSNFFWMPSVAQAPSTNLITVQALDNGTPPLVGSQTFQVIVALPPRLRFSTLNPSNIALSFDAWPGKSYQVLYKNNLQDPAWSLLTIASNNNGIILLPINPAPNPQRFFRVGIVN